MSLCPKQCMRARFKLTPRRSFSVANELAAGGWGGHPPPGVTQAIGKRRDGQPQAKV